MTREEAEAVRILRAYGDPACYEEMVQAIVRGCAEDIDAHEDGVLLCHAVAKAYMLAWRTRERLERMLARVPADGSDIVLHGTLDEQTLRGIQERFSLANVLYMREYAYYGAIPERETAFDVRPLEMDALDFVYENYGHASREYIEARLRSGVMLGAYDGDAIAGFIGEHAEGSEGLLHVMPAYRRRGVGAALERAAIRRMMLQGFTPYGQVLEGNEVSHALQARLGMTRAQGRVYWLTNDTL